jgi:hypothetical protein
MAQPRIEWAVEEAVRGPGCAVCALLRQDEERYWDGFLYERFQDPDVFRAVRAARGFCGRHTSQLSASRDVVPGATMALAATQGALDLLATRPQRRLLRRGAPATSAPEDRCAVCARLRRTQDLVLRELDRQLQRGGAVAEAFDRSAGLCVEHVTAARSLGVERSEAIEAPTRRALAAAAEELEALLASFDYRSAPADSEMVEAWQRALPLLRGDPGAIHARPGD